MIRGSLRSRQGAFLTKEISTTKLSSKIHKTHYGTKIMHNCCICVSILFFIMIKSISQQLRYRTWYAVLLNCEKSEMVISYNITFTNQQLAPWRQQFSMDTYLEPDFCFIFLLVFLTLALYQRKDALEWATFTSIWRVSKNTK